MNYQELSGLAAHQQWAAEAKAKVDAVNAAILAARQKQLDARERIGVGDFVVVGFGLDGENVLRVAHDWGEFVQLTDGRYGSSFHLGDGYVSFSGGLNPGIDVARFERTEERREGPVWFFSENWARAHNGYHCNATFRVWVLRAETAAPSGEPSVCIAGNPTVEGLPCGDPDCVCATKGGAE